MATMYLIFIVPYTVV